MKLNQRRGQSRKKKPNCIDHFTCAEEAEGSPFVSLFFPSTYHKYCISDFDGHLSKNYSSWAIFHSLVYFTLCRHLTLQYIIYLSWIPVHLLVGKLAVHKLHHSALDYLSIKKKKKKRRWILVLFTVTYQIYVNAGYFKLAWLNAKAILNNVLSTHSPGNKFPYMIKKIC